MPVLVTGASGFLGGRLVEMLAARGEQVVVLVRPSSQVGHLDGLLAGSAVRLVRAELAFDFEARDVDPGVREAMLDVTVVYHCAGCSTDWATPRTYQQGNVLATQALLAAAAGAPELERFVHVSTTDVYGYPPLPCAETVEPLDTGLGYNHSKILGEQAVWHASASGLPVTVVRPATIYGPRGTAFVTDIAKLLRERTMAYVDGGRMPGGFVYVDDVAEAMIAAAASPVAAGQAYNLSSLQGETWKQYCVLLAKAIGLPAPWINLPFAAAMGVAALMEAPHRYLRVPGRPLLTRHAVYLLGRDQEFPSAKAQADLGYAPSVSLENGVARSAAWLRGQQKSKA
jgi:nucleoside-diphosphate-sugar epimerase